VYCCDLFPEHIMPAGQKMVEWLSRMTAVPSEFKSAIMEVLGSLWHIAHTAELDDVFTRIPQRVAPAEFVFIGVVLYATRGSTWEVRADEIYKMRKHIRSRFSDVRMRNDIIKVLWTFVDDVVQRLDTGQSSSRGAGKKSTKKRKGRRREDSDAEMSDDHSKKKGAQTSKRAKGKSGR